MAYRNYVHPSQAIPRDHPLERHNTMLEFGSVTQHGLIARFNRVMHGSPEKAAPGVCIKQSKRMKMGAFGKAYPKEHENYCCKYADDKWLDSCWATPQATPTHQIFRHGVQTEPRPPKCLQKQPKCQNSDSYFFCAKHALRVHTDNQMVPSAPGMQSTYQSRCKTIDFLQSCFSEAHYNAQRWACAYTETVELLDAEKKKVQILKEALKKEKEKAGSQKKEEKDEKDKVEKAHKEELKQANAHSVAEKARSQAKRDKTKKPVVEKEIKDLKGKIAPLKQEITDAESAEGYDAQKPSEEVAAKKIDLNLLEAELSAANSQLDKMASSERLPGRGFGFSFRGTRFQRGFF
jgi:hypothetical protein